MDGQTRINGVVLCITPRVLAIAVHVEISMMNWGYGNPTGNHHEREVLSTVRSIYQWLRTLSIYRLSMVTDPPRRVWRGVCPRWGAAAGGSRCPGTARTARTAPPRHQGEGGDRPLEVRHFNILCSFIHLSTQYSEEALSRYVLRLLYCISKIFIFKDQLEVVFTYKLGCLLRTLCVSTLSCPPCSRWWRCGWWWLCLAMTPTELSTARYSTGHTSIGPVAIYTFKSRYYLSLWQCWLFGVSGSNIAICIASSDW